MLTLTEHGLLHLHTVAPGGVSFESSTVFLLTFLWEDGKIHKIGRLGAAVAPKEEIWRDIFYEEAIT